MEEIERGEEHAGDTLNGRNFLRGKLAVYDWILKTEWIICYAIHLKKKKEQITDTTWMSLADIMLSERRKIQKIIYNMIPVNLMSKTELIVGDRNENNGGLEWGWLERDMRELSGGDGNVLWKVIKKF